MPKVNEIIHDFLIWVHTIKDHSLKYSTPEYLPLISQSVEEESL